jgi:TRAP-type uncharacterized transport system substrate-binding protein
LVHPDAPGDLLTELNKAFHSNVDNLDSVKSLFPSSDDEIEQFSYTVTGIVGATLM